MQSEKIINLKNPPSDYIARVVKVLELGEVIAYPTDTIYGLGCDATNPSAVERINELKGRPAGKPMSVLYYNLERLLSDFPNLNRYQKMVVQSLLPGKITLILPSNELLKISPILKADGWVGVRVIDLPLINDILKRFPNPIITTSVNPAGLKPAISVEEILNYFGDEISLILDYGKIENPIPSTVVRVFDDHIQIERVGAVSEELIKEKMGLL